MPTQGNFRGTLCKGKKTIRVPPWKNVEENNKNSIVTTEQGQGSKPKHKSPANHPLFGVRQYIHKNHNSSDPILYVNVIDHLSYKIDIGNYCELI
ncbi:hypothetical protein GBA52_024520 [Prunus armeniaca]|nr:hypothetical protein GBA52_024520 [Prunus armeniaca]